MQHNYYCCICVTDFAGPTPLAMLSSRMHAWVPHKSGLHTLDTIIKSSALSEALDTYVGHIT